MKFVEFKRSLSGEKPPQGLSDVLTALWYDAKGHWEKAHELAQSVDSVTGAWVHAYLHRKEGDLGNAKYWYAKANRPVSDLSLDEEWQEIVESMINK